MLALAEANPASAAATTAQTEKAQAAAAKKYLGGQQTFVDFAEKMVKLKLQPAHLKGSVGCEESQRYFTFGMVRLFLGQDESTADPYVFRLSRALLILVVCGFVVFVTPPHRCGMW
jgi:hypothetical protein